MATITSILVNLHPLVKGQHRYTPNAVNTAVANNSGISGNIVNAFQTITLHKNDSDGSAFTVTTQTIPQNSFVVNSGASQHMVNSLSLLVSLQSTSN
jgi:hypothetical protein